MDAIERMLRWFPGELNHDTGFHRIMAEKMPATGRLLDLGCGNNFALGRYRTSEREVWGTDFAAHPNLHHPEWFRLLGSEGKIPFPDAYFDVVSSFMVMEHVAAPDLFFAEIARVLKPNGVYVGQSIHSLHYVTWIRQAMDFLPHRWIQALVKKLYGRDECDTFPTQYLLNRRGRIRMAADTSKLAWDDWRCYASQGYFHFSPLLTRFAILGDWTLNQLRPDLGKLYFTVILRKPAASPTLNADLPSAA
jgi:SAM-dependent methyltransferase